MTADVWAISPYEIGGGVIGISMHCKYNVHPAQQGSPVVAQSAKQEHLAVEHKVACMQVTVHSQKYVHGTNTSV